MIGKTRWDRDSTTAPWQRSEQEPLRQPEPFWGSDPRRNARLLGPGRVSFYDPKLPAWFELTVDPRTGRLLALRMTAAVALHAAPLLRLRQAVPDRAAAALTDA